MAAGRLMMVAPGVGKVAQNRVYGAAGNNGINGINGFWVSQIRSLHTNVCSCFLNSWFFYAKKPVKFALDLMNLINGIGNSVP